MVLAGSGGPHCASASPGRAHCLGARGAGPAGTCSLPGAPRCDQGGTQLRESETRLGTRAQCEGRLRRCKTRRGNQRPEPSVLGPDSEVTGRRGGSKVPTAQPEPVRDMPTVWTSSGLDKGRPGPAVRRTPFLWATPGPRGRCSPGTAKHARGPRTRRPVTVRRFTRTRARALTKVHFVSSKGAKGSTTRGRPGTGDRVGGRAARAPPGGGWRPGRPAPGGQDSRGPCVGSGRCGS